MPLLLCPDLLRPSDFQEVPRGGRLQIREVDSEAQIMKKLGSFGAVGIPTTPDFETVRWFQTSNICF